MTRSLVLVHEALVDQRIDGGGCLANGSRSGGLITLGDGLGGIADRRARARAQRDIAGAVLDGLAGGFFGRLGVGHG